MESDVRLDGRTEKETSSEKTPLVFCHSLTVTHVLSVSAIKSLSPQ